MKRVVIDTNILIYWYKAGDVTFVGNLSEVSPIFSIITQIEALGFQGITEKEITAIKVMLNTGEIIPLDQELANRTIDIRQKNKIRTPDAIVAATSLLNDAELWTANTKDFAKVKGLKLYNPIG